jgi:hypothetical protein
MIVFVFGWLTLITKSFVLASVTQQCGLLIHPNE